jgi:hypothetical protein
MIRTLKKVFLKQGDQIGRIFAHLAFVFFGQFFEKYRNSANSLATFFHETSYVLVSTKDVFGYSLGDFFRRLTWSPC